jgi:hypothetical protein
VHTLNQNMICRIVFMSFTIVYKFMFLILFMYLLIVQVNNLGDGGHEFIYGMQLIFVVIYKSLPFLFNLT